MHAGLFEGRSPMFIEDGKSVVPICKTYEKCISTLRDRLGLEIELPPGRPTDRFEAIVQHLQIRRGSEVRAPNVEVAVEDIGASWDFRDIPPTDFTYFFIEALREAKQECKNGNLEQCVVLFRDIAKSAMNKIKIHYGQNFRKNVTERAFLLMSLYVDEYIEKTSWVQRHGRGKYAATAKLKIWS